MREALAIRLSLRFGRSSVRLSRASPRGKVLWQIEHIRLEVSPPLGAEGPSSHMQANVGIHSFGVSSRLSMCETPQLLAVVEHIMPRVRARKLWVNPRTRGCSAYG